MKIDKKQGIEMLRYLKMPTIAKIELSDIENDRSILEQGLSIRTSPKTNRNNCVNLPSIHNCKDFEVLEHFIEENKDEYNLFIHKTVKPELIGSVSRYGNSNEKKLSIEFFKNFDDRKHEKIENGVMFPIEGGRPTIHKMEMTNCKKEEFNKFSKVLGYIYNWPFEIYDAEFVIEDGNIIFTDLTVQDTPELRQAERCKISTDRER